jgi:hypothetical protein
MEPAGLQGTWSFAGPPGKLHPEQPHPPPSCFSTMSCEAVSYDLLPQSSQPMPTSAKDWELLLLSSQPECYED